MKLTCEKWGEGQQPLVLLHGFTGQRSGWRHLEPFLSPWFRVTSVDLPGHGDSELPRRMGEAGFQQTVEALAKLLDSIARGPVALAGYSLGARVALAIALAHPSRVFRLVLESGSPGIRRRKLRAARRREDERWATLIESQGLRRFVEAWEAQPQLASLQKLPDAMRLALRARRMSGNPLGLVGALRCLGAGVQPSYWGALPSLTVPTLLVTGALDAKFCELAAEMRAQLPMAWSCVVPNVGHAPHLEAPEAYASEVTRFVGTPWIEAPLADTAELQT